MQTFVPFESYKRCARVLDNKRLGKQRIECVQILNTLSGLSAGWANHPAVKMWAGHENALAIYTEWICTEWISRGYVDNQLERVRELRHSIGWPSKSSLRPVWWGTEVHDSHKAQLLRKNYDHYLQSICRGDEEMADKLMEKHEGYIWP